MNVLYVKTPDEDDMFLIECASLSFDGGTLICFKDAEMRQVVAAFAPYGWSYCNWGVPE